MWLGLIALILVVAAILLSIVSGGIFTIVLVPLAVIAVISAVVSATMGASAANAPSDGNPRARREPGVDSLPHSRPAETANHQPATPEDLVDARRGA